MANINDPQTRERGFDLEVENQALGLAIIAVVAVIGGGVYSALPDSLKKTYETSPDHPYSYVGDASTDERLNGRFSEFTARCEENGPDDPILKSIVRERRTILIKMGVVDDISWKCRRNTEPGRKGWVLETVPRRAPELPVRHQDRGRGAQTER